MRTTVLLLVAAFGLAACGGGGGAGGSVLAGPYWRFDVEGDTTGQSDLLLVFRGTAYLHEDGTSTSDVRIVGVETRTGREGTHRVTAERELIGEGGWVWGMEGGVSPLGRCAVAGRVNDSVGTKMMILLGHVGGFDESSLQGAYRVVGLCYRYGEVGSIFSCLADFDGAGAYEAPSMTTNRRGLVATSTPDTGLTYAVTQDGRLTMDEMKWGWTLEGGILAGGQVAIAAGPVEDETTFERFLYVLLETGSGLDDASFAGPYWTVTMQYMADATRSTTGTLTSNGDGVFAYSFQECFEAGLTDPSVFNRTYTGTYAAGADGSLSMTGDGVTLEGGMSPAGDFFALAGGTEDGDKRVLMFGVVR